MAYRKMYAAVGSAVKDLHVWENRQRHNLGFAEWHSQRGDIHRFE
jgi:hypothetical protein